MSHLRSAYRRLRHAARCVLGQDLRFRVETKVPLARHGSEYGGWWLCPVGLGPDSIVYSAGIGRDISFDLSLIETFGVTVCAFDPTPASIAWVRSQQLPERYTWYALALGGRDGDAAFFPPANPEDVSHTALSGMDVGRQSIRVEMKRLPTIARELGHERIDVLKMDIEGSEYEVLDDLLTAEMDVRQLLVEFHHRFPAIGVEQTRRAVNALAARGFQVFHISETGEEYSFIRSPRQAGDRRLP